MGARCTRTRRAKVGVAAAGTKHGAPVGAATANSSSRPRSLRHQKSTLASASSVTFLPAANGGTVASSHAVQWSRVRQRRQPHQPRQEGPHATDTRHMTADVRIRVNCRAGQKVEEGGPVDAVVHVGGSDRVFIGNTIENVKSRRRTSCPPCVTRCESACDASRQQRIRNANSTLTPFHTPQRRMSAPPAVKREWIADAMWQSGSVRTWSHASPPVIVDPDGWCLADVDRAEVWRRQREEHHAAVRERRAQLEGFINPVVQLLHSDTIPDEDSIMSDATPPTGFLHAQLAS